MTGAQLDRASTPFWMALGDEAADEIADLAAKECRLSAATRARVALSEQKARAVRKRLLRANLEAVAVEKRLPRGKKESAILLLAPPLSPSSGPSMFSPKTAGAVWCVTVVRPRLL